MTVPVFLILIQILCHPSFYSLSLGSFASLRNGDGTRGLFYYQVESYGPVHFLRNPVLGIRFIHRCLGSQLLSHSIFITYYLHHILFRCPLTIGVGFEAGLSHRLWACGLLGKVFRADHNPECTKRWGGMRLGESCRVREGLYKK